VPHRQDHDLFPVEVIEGDVSSTSKFNDPLAEFGRQLFDWSTGLGVPAQHSCSLPDRFDGATGRFRAFGGEKIMEAGHIPQSGV
jgi:hypothetical protein